MFVERPARTELLLIFDSTGNFKVFKVVWMCVRLCDCVHLRLTFFACSAFVSLCPFKFGMSNKGVFVSLLNPQCVCI